MKKIIALLLAAFVLTGGLALLVKRPDLRYRAVNAVYELVSRREDTPVRAEVQTRTVPAEMLAENGAELNDCLMLVNGTHLLSKNYEPDLVSYKDVPFERHTAEAYAALSAAVSERFGEKLYVSSTYRTAEEQREILNEQGGDTAQAVGASEHQTGLAADVYVQGFAGEGFIKCEAGQWVNDRCADYGFIVRYPAGKSGITGISYEPWHLRYVGLPHAEIITRNGLTLEEYADFLGDGYLEYGGWLISHQSSTDTVELPESFRSCAVSPDGMGGWFVTAKR